MRNRNAFGMMFKGLAFSLLLQAVPGHAAVTLRDSTYDWKTWDISERADHGINGQNLNNSVVRHFKTKILENEFLVVTILPDYGARILSILYKPTGHEQLFQNPMGFADGIGAGSFYYDWLMVLGGIFPTFPEPEHGKTYLLPWKSEVVLNTPDKVSVAMSIQDNVNFSGHPAKFNIGVTGLTCIATVTLASGKASVELGLQLINDKTQSVRYEYWTCHAMAPGSTPGDTKAPKSTEIVVPIEKYSIGFGLDGIDKPVDGGMEYKNLAFFKNWPNMGIAYAEPAITKKWWGVINHDNEEGLFRIVDDPAATPGLKFWTWGYKDNYPLNARERQFIELWAGAGHQFFSPIQIAANTTRKWTETYIPTVGLKKIASANENALVSFTTDKTTYDGGTDKSIVLTADLVSATPALPLRVRFTGGVQGDIVLLDTTILPDAKSASHFQFSRPLSMIGSGKQNIDLHLENPLGASLLEATAPVSVQNVVLSTRFFHRGAFGPVRMERLSTGRITLRFPDARMRAIEVMNIGGERLYRTMNSGGVTYTLPAMPGPGLYLLRISEGGESSTMLISDLAHP